MKPLLAANYVESKLQFPLGAQAKIDGVRGLTTEGYLTGRSLKKHKNLYTTKFYSGKEYSFFDGELAAADDKDPELCRKTSAALSTIGGEPFTFWHVFDYLHPRIVGAPYKDRYEYLENLVRGEKQAGRCAHALVVPMFVCNTLDELLRYDSQFIEQGYEGTIIRGLDSFHKEGRSTVKAGELLRIKRFVESEAEIVSLEEGSVNDNEAQTNKLGRTFRTSHMLNKRPNGMIGSIQAIMQENVEWDGEVILQKQSQITISPGNMNHAFRKHYWDNPSQLLGKVCKFRFFPKGIKDKPRFPTFVSLRSAEDIS